MSEPIRTPQGWFCPVCRKGQLVLAYSWWCRFCGASGVIGTGSDGGEDA